MNYWNNPFDLYGNYVFNRDMFLLGQQDITAWRDIWPDEFQF